MKPYNNPVFQVSCYICGEPGWNEDAISAWYGEQFRCQDGCYPENVKRYQREQIRKEEEAKKT